MRRILSCLAVGIFVLGLGCAEDEPPDVSLWSVYRGPTVGGVSLKGLDGSGPRDVWTVGAGGTILHYDGFHWAQYEMSITDLDLYAVVMTSGSSGWAVGADGIVLRYGNGQWYDNYHAGGHDLYGVAFAEDGTGFAVGDGGAIFRYDGAVWQDVSPAGVTANLRAVATTATGSAWAVGDGGTILYFDGAVWQQLTSPTTEKLNALALAPDGVYAAGDAGVILYNAGSGWSVMATPTTRELHGVAATAAMAFAGGNDGSLVGAKDGVWGPVGLDAGPVNINAVTLCNSAEGWAVGDQAVILRYGRAWN